MESFRLIRDKLGWTRYKMAKYLGITDSRYKYLEAQAAITQLSVLKKLRELAYKTGMSADEFWEILDADIVLEKNNPDEFAVKVKPKK